MKLHLHVKFMKDHESWGARVDLKQVLSLQKPGRFRRFIVTHGIIYFDYFKHQTRRKFSQRLVSPINKTWLMITIAHSLTQRNKVGNLLGAESR